MFTQKSRWLKQTFPFILISSWLTWSTAQLHVITINCTFKGNIKCDILHFRYFKCFNSKSVLKNILKTLYILLRPVFTKLCYGQIHSFVNTDLNNIHITALANAIEHCVLFRSFTFLIYTKNFIQSMGINSLSEHVFIHNAAVVIERSFAIRAGV